MDCQAASGLLSGGWKFKPLENRPLSGTQEPKDPQSMFAFWDCKQLWFQWQQFKVHEILSLNKHISRNFYNSHLSCFWNRLRNKFIKPCEVPASKQRRLTEVIARISTVCHAFNFAGATATHYCILPMLSLQLQELLSSVLHQHEGLHQSSHEEPFLRLGNEATSHSWSCCWEGMEQGWPIYCPAKFVRDPELSLAWLVLQGCPTWITPISAGLLVGLGEQPRSVFTSLGHGKGI